jgi:hypothetical protein
MNIVPPQYVVGLNEGGNPPSSVAMVDKGNTSYPEISSLVAGGGVTLAKNLDNSVTISSTGGGGGVASVDNAPTAGSTNELVDDTDPANPKIRQITGGSGITITNNPADPGPGVASYVISATQPTIKTIDLTRLVTLPDLVGSQFSTASTGFLLNFCNIVEYATFVQLSGVISFDKPAGQVSGTLPSDLSYFINYPSFPTPKDVTGAVQMGGTVSEFSKQGWTTGSRLFTPGRGLNPLTFWVNTNVPGQPGGSPLSNTYTSFSLRFSLTYEKA